MTHPFVRLDDDSYNLSRSHNRWPTPSVFSGTISRTRHILSRLIFISVRTSEPLPNIYGRYEGEDEFMNSKVAMGGRLRALRMISPSGSLNSSFAVAVMGVVKSRIR